MTAAVGDAAPVTLWFCPNDQLAPGLANALAAQWLDEQERESAGQFLFERDRRQYLVAHVMVRRVLSLESGIPESEAVIWRSSRGRPFLQKPAGGLPRGGRELDFNLSHAGGHNLLGVVRRHRIGVDVERLDRGKQGLAGVVHAFAPEEREWVAQAPAGRERDVRVLRLWTLKEAYSKARGLGLGLSFDSFAFQLDEDRGVRAFRPPDDDLAQRWRFVELEPVPGVLAAVALMAGEDETPVLALHHGFPWSRSSPRTVTVPRPAPLPGVR
ncbi:MULTISPECIES: 4'-phosphopantetheinyl transferase superfamily protein [Streptomyces]|uniref:4'-phosphopantetheinyl transferase family protein n=1 Tax=Streptomyces TaxID=1883 RepID=UPI001163CA2D|nr:MULTISPECIES: 4'-phosphopantetheinyl transferase superfamily protein [unclassified Streptomyces]MBL0803760.1 4'-phosphopantetheinyl transferase superfamily protein [Streptomyces albidoflavus]NUV32929.1 4'-phosphopantetheinyl transferase superfamily protein [Streptomyces sp. KAI-27]NUV46125.1 4'-phosphopantetheinyl transferase superfamily protein [Streptomyces sp. CAI-78]MBV1957482.1 4'-phosphopantetheinyl transferase superfamily protein [Streptomyces sp. BV333]MCK2145487.1 4'-phosphopanteth